MNGLYCYPEQRACVSREKKVYEYYIPEILLTYPRTPAIGLNGQTRSKALSGWLCITHKAAGGCPIQACLSGVVLRDNLLRYTKQFFTMSRD